MSQQQPDLGPVSLSRIASFLAIIGLLIFAAIWLKSLLVPLVFAAVFALTLRPICNWVERYVQIDWLSIVITFVIAALPVAAAVVVFTYQTVEVMDDLPTITEEFQESLNRIFIYTTDKLDLELEVSGYDWVRGQLGDALDQPFLYLSGLVTGAGGVVGTLLLIFLYTFLLLLYRSPLHHFILGQFGGLNRERIDLVLADTQRMSYTYLKGLGIVMVILGLLNSVGLTLIGIDYAFFWGFLAAFLAIIPYIGTTIGGLLPFLYALSTTDNALQPILVVILFTTVQGIEGNIITPKVVGSSIQVNPLAAIIALFFGGFVWGVEGLILALPLTAMIRILMVHSHSFRPFGLLLSDDLQRRDVEFLGALDEDHYRIVNFFRVRRNVPPPGALVSHKLSARETLDIEVEEGYREDITA